MGSDLHNSYSGACGGIIRDHPGKFVAAFNAFLGDCSITMAELWGAYIGLKLAYQLGVRRVTLEMDSTCAIRLITARTDAQHTGFWLVRAIKDLMAKDWEVVPLHTYLEANHCADGLARNAHGNSHGVTFFILATSFLSVLFQLSS